MKVLLSAIACHPRLGSEAKVGWDAACTISESAIMDECHVMTHIANRDAIVQAQEAGLAARVHFHFVGKPYRYHPNRMLARLQSWLIYRKWQAHLLSFSLDLHSKVGFDLTHHVTYVTWRVASPLWKLPIPFVWGPIGGTSMLPREFFGILSGPAMLFEIARQASSFVASRSRAFLDCAMESSVVVAGNEETETFLRRFRPTTNIERLSPVFFSAQQIAALRDLPRENPTLRRPLRLFAGGNLEGRKGVALALETIAELKRRRIDVKYTFGGHGPELHSLRNLAQTLGIEDRVEFHQGFHREDYIRRLKESDVYFLPSFRETTPITLLEAVLAGCYPVVADNSGAGEILRRIGGTAVLAHDRRQIVSDLADALEWCDRNRSLIAFEAHKASAKAADEFGKARYIRRINEIYQQATGGKA